MVRLVASWLARCTRNLSPSFLVFMVSRDSDPGIFLSIIRWFFLPPDQVFRLFDEFESIEMASEGVK